MPPILLSFLFILLGFTSETRTQNFFYSTEFGGRGPQVPSNSRPIFDTAQSSAQASVSGGAGNSVNAGSAGMINGSLQEQFAEIFDWNKDLALDSRFRACTVPDIGDVSRACPKRAFFFGLNPQHRRAVGMVKQILTQRNDPLMTVCLAGAMRDLPGMNPNVWIRGLLGAHLSDVGLFDLEVPPMVEVMPHIFLPRESIQDARRQGTFSPGSRRCTVIDGSVGADNGVENLLWYFREDVQVNSFHLNWHLIYPFTGVTRKADRQGELFYFTHHSHLARYHAERLSNGLKQVTPLYLNANTRVPDHYHPHLDDTNSGMRWSARRPNRPVQDTVFINITGVPPNISVADRSLHVSRVEESVRNGRLLLRNGQTLRLDSRTGVDILGDVIEASVFTPNGEHYGSFGFHNEGHVLLSLIEDPQNATGVPPGVMLEVATSMRDPAFYTYHAAMDESFDLHKRQLPPYQPETGELPLKLEGMEISNVEVIPDDGIANRLTTFLNQKTFELSRGLDFNRTGVQGPVTACVTHLDHAPFSYQIYAYRHPQAASGRATARIFMAPRFDENGKRYTLLEQRKLFFMLDLFTVLLYPGLNRIRRRSTDSALTIDIPQSLQEIQKTKPEKVKEKRRTYCGCGWPHHLLIPRGSAKGMSFDLFVMLTNGVDDYVAPANRPPRPTECKPAPIYCGRLNDTYPDSRPMGYPFDRLPYYAPTHWWERPRYVDNLEEYTSGIPNMAITQVVIQHNGRTAPPSSIRFEDKSRTPSQLQETAITPEEAEVEVPTLNSNPDLFQSFGLEGSLQVEQNSSASNQVRFEEVESVPLIHQEHRAWRGPYNAQDVGFTHTSSAHYHGSQDDEAPGRSNEFNAYHHRSIHQRPAPPQYTYNNPSSSTYIFQRLFSNGYADN